MSVQIKSVDLVVPGRVARKFNKDGDTVLTLNAEQVVAVFELTGQIADLFPPQPLVAPSLEAVKALSGTTA
jgi:hypothetical protein